VNQESNTPQQSAIWAALKTVMDPEVGIDIVEMGMVYTVAVTDNRAKIEITMTSPSCPLHVSITNEARQAVARALPSLTEVDVQVVWEPPWTPERMSEAARKTLGGAH